MRMSALRERRIQVPAKNRDKPAKTIERMYRSSYQGQSGNTLVGTAVVFNESTVINDFLGQYEEVIEPTAFDECDFRNVAFCVNHNWASIPLAHSRNNNDMSTMKLSVDKDGLNVNVKLDVERNTEAAALYSAIDRGDITGMSFCGHVKEDEWTEREGAIPLRTIKKIDYLLEVSAVTFPAYPQTDIDARSKPMAPPESLEEPQDNPALEEEERAAEKAAIELLKAKINIAVKSII